MARAIPLLSRVVESCPPDPEAANDAGSDYAGRDPNFIPYIPHPKQAYFHDLSRDRVQKGCFGGLGAGKSAIGANELLYFLCGYNRERPAVYIVGAPTYPMLRDSCIPAVRQWFPTAILAGGRWEAALNRSAMSLRLWNGAVILFRSLGGDNYERVRNIEIAGANVEEASLLEDDAAYNVLLGRLRAKVPRHFLNVITTMRGENWVARDFILAPKPDTVHVRIKTTDNPHLPPNYVKMLLGKYSTRHARQELDGEIVTPEGEVFPALSRKPWPDGNTLDVRMDPYRPAWVFVDFGRRRPSVLVVQQFDAVHPQTGATHKLDAIVWELQDAFGKAPEDLVVDAWIPRLRELRLPWRFIHGDPAGDSRNDQTHETSANKLRDALGCAFLPPIQAWQRSKERGEELVSSRICAADGTRSLVWASTGVVDALGQPQLFAPNSFKSMQSLRYPERKPGHAAATESLKDGEHDHDADAIRYGMVMMHGRERVERPWEPQRVRM